MKPRFPNMEVVRMGLPQYESPSARLASEAGALRGIYEVAQKEYEILRGLATAALSGHPDALMDLKSYLAVQEGIAELYAKELEKK